ncbi:MAG: argininosuccinate synthase [Phycisphaerales bacterium]|nr:argininosuccinate synthase [Phycisphaerales bacterium]
MPSKVVLAFSGGLDTSYCAVWLREQGYEVHTVTVLTDPPDTDASAELTARAQALGVASHTNIDARRELFDDYLRYLIFANALRGEVYPLCVSAERMAQARRTALHAVALGAQALSHGSTGAGNDQVRFDVAFRIFAPQLEILTPIRDQALSREQETAYLERHGVPVPRKTTTYSINRGLWGVTIGGAETHRSDGVLPEEAYILTAGLAQRPSSAETLELTFERGVPTALDGAPLDPVRLIAALDARAGRHGVGRGMHVGDTILGIKGRVAFEAPAALVLVQAHRELEKLVQSRQQMQWKRTLGDVYSGGLHEARFFDPLMRDIEAFLRSSQQRVTGVVRVQLFQGQATVLGATSPHALLGRQATYGEGTRLWTGAEAAAFAKLYGLGDWLAAQAAPGQEGAADAHLG